MMKFILIIKGKISLEPREMVEDDTFQAANGGIPPEWGLDLSFKNAVIHYGPWADRQR
jgi:hypothetical protein